jgi:hypothetical protein
VGRLLPLYPRLLCHHGADAHGGACRAHGRGMVQRPGFSTRQAAGCTAANRSSGTIPDGHLRGVYCNMPHLLQHAVPAARPPKGRASSGVFRYAGSTCRTKSYSRYTMSPCATPAAPSGRPPRARSVNCSGSRLVSWFRGECAVWVSVGRDAPGCALPCLHVTGCAQQPASKMQPWDGCARHRCAMARRDGEEDKACCACYKTGNGTWNGCYFTWASAHQLGVL